MATKKIAPEPPYELELLRVGPVLCDSARNWTVGGDFPSIDQAEDELRRRLASEPIYQFARVRQYGPGRSTAHTNATWRLRYERVLRRVEWDGFGRPKNTERIASHGG